MKKTTIFLGVIVVFALIVAVIVFTGASDAKLPGTYAMADASGSNSEMFMVTAGDATLQINSDNTGTLSMLGQETAVIVNADESKISFDNGATYTTFTFDGKKLTIEGGGSKIVFKKK